ncbi:MFS transporter [Solihabitans fulvus]|uniref:MFS transporter n=1 Tax=Solihabitans fulvus TaxID=1892852 RepID=A0A5B2WP86_9PSEU|nr:MFS transporter [Solihabitans fulvus]KAA2253571.1 MFS transporter [Solihabitans fulvus]
MYRRLLALALGTFAIGTDSFVVAGILPQVSSSMSVSVESAGQLVTVYALSYALLSPVMAAATAHWARKQLLLTGLAVFVVGNVATALLPVFGLVLASRVIAGLGAAIYTPTASGVAAMLAPPEKRGKALAIVMAGLSGATALGAPIGTVIGSLSDWRGTMWFVAALGLAALIGVAILLPAVPSLPPIGLRKRLAPIGDARVAFTLLTTVFVLGGLYTVYTYISLSYDRATGGAGTKLAVLLFAFGVAATAGNLSAGSLVDKLGARRVINVAVIIALIDFALMPITSAYFPTAILAVIVWGLCGWGVLVPQQHRLISISPASAPLVIALNAAGIYIAVSASGLLGAAGINLVGAHNLGFISAVLILLGLVSAEIANSIIQRRKAAAAAATPADAPAPAANPASN